MNRRLRAVIGVFGVAMFAFLCGETVQAGQESAPWKASLLSRVVSIRNVRLHMTMLERIARQHGNNRASGAPGYDRASRYVTTILKAAGYRVNLQRFEFPFFQELAQPLLQRTSPGAEPYPPDDPQGFYTVQYSGSGDIDGVVVPVNVVMPPGGSPNTSSSGCQAEDFIDFPAGAIALIQRGTCSYYDKAKNAQLAGASAVVFYNEGQAGRTEAFTTTVQKPEFAFPVVFASYEIGRELYDLSQSQEVRVHVRTDTRSEIRETHNILASTRSGSSSRTVIVGAHLDSELAGPGVNDNASGAAAVLETAVEMARWGIRPKNRIIFAFWGAEEYGLLGSAHYVNGLTAKQLADIRVYLNFDMIASPNWVRFVSDGDGSDTGSAGPPGSGFIEQVFVDYFNSKGMPTEPGVMDGRSDYASFMEAGVPAGFLLAGMEGIKTPEQEAIYGGTAGLPYDPNYHTARDTLKNASLTIEAQMLSAIGYAAGYFADKTLPAPGVKSHEAAAPCSFERRGPLFIR